MPEATELPAPLHATNVRNEYTLVSPSERKWIIRYSNQVMARARGAQITNTDAACGPVRAFTKWMKDMKHQDWIFVLAGLAALAGLFVFFKPSTAPPPTPPLAASTAAQAPAATVPTPRVFELVIADGKLQSGPRLIQLPQGETVALKVTSDRNDELHVHGYDLHAQLRAHTPATLSFKADRSGRFEYERHKAQVELGVLEVQPR